MTIDELETAITEAKKIPGISGKSQVLLLARSGKKLRTPYTSITCRNDEGFIQDPKGQCAPDNTLVLYHDPVSPRN